MAELEIQFSGAELKFFFLLFQGAFGEALTAQDVIDWGSTYGFGDNAFVLLDPNRAGYEGFFPGVPGKDGTIVLARGATISAIKPADHATAIQNALNQ